METNLEQSLKLEAQKTVKMLKRMVDSFNADYYMHWNKRDDIYTVDLTRKEWNKNLSTSLQVKGKVYSYNEEIKPEHGFISIGDPNLLVSAVKVLPRNVKEIYFQVVLGDDNNVILNAGFTNEYCQLVAVLDDGVETELTFNVYHNVMTKRSKARFAVQP